MTAPNTSIPTTKVGITNSNVYDALLAGVKWGGAVGTGATLTYSFPWAGGANAVFSGPNGMDYSSRNEPYGAEHYALNAVQQVAVRNAIQSWANVANIKVSEVADSSTSVGDIRVGWTSAVDDDFWGWGYYPNPSYAQAGDIWISTKSSGATDKDWSTGSYNYMSLIHEVGHALGLQHPFEGPTVLSERYDNRLYTLMSYDNAPDSLFVKVTDYGNTVGWESHYVQPETPMVYDIAVIQYLYGANMSYHTGDDVYSFDPAKPFFKTIWDAGGNDTISVANFTEGCTINLAEGALSSISIPSDDGSGYTWTKAPPTPTYDGSNNLGIAFGVTIENAIGGAGDDILYGNGANNHLRGNGGINVLNGGDGIDTAIYGSNYSQYMFTPHDGLFTVVATSLYDDQADAVSNIERLVFKDVTVALTVNGLAEDALQAQYTALAQKFYVAYFGRPADANGLASMVARFSAAGVPATTSAFVNAYATDSTVKSLVDSFGNSAESAALYHGSNRDFITAIYANVLGRAPDKEGLDFWAGALDAGNLVRGLAALNIVAGAEGNTTAQGLIDAALIANRITVAENFTTALDTPAEVAKYAGSVAAAAAKGLLDAVTQNTSIISYESTVLNLVDHLPAAAAAQIVGVQTPFFEGLPA